MENLELKESVKHRINKSDYVITLDFENEYEEYKKINNLIIVTAKTDKKDIWQMVNKLNTKDIIFLKENNEKYIANRILNTINN